MEHAVVGAGANGRRGTVRPVVSVASGRKGFILAPKFVFIDGRTGATMYSERHREEILYSPQQNTPALSSAKPNFSKSDFINNPAYCHSERSEESQISSFVSDKAIRDVSLRST